MKSIGVELLSEAAHVPFRGSAKAAGLDLFTPFMFDLPAGAEASPAAGYFALA